MHQPKTGFWRSIGIVLIAVCCSAAADDGKTSAPKNADMALFVLQRLAYGPTPGALEHVMDIGADAYIEEQLHPESLAEPEALTARLSQMETLDADAVDLYASFGPPFRRAATEEAGAQQRVHARQVAITDEAREARLLRAVYSPAQLREMMVDFWFNHFNVFAGKDQEMQIWVGAYERDAIRPYVFGKFRELLGATAKHPAMLYYLDNWQSAAVRTDKQGKTSGGINENYARELMELHTLGVDGGYTQKDVTELARMLSGWRFDPKALERREKPAFRFDPKRHDTGAKRWLGHDFPAGSGDDNDIQEGERALDILARHPATAKHIAYQLAQYFVADEPPRRLVNQLAQRYRQTDGDIRAVLTTLFKSREFRDPANRGNKFKTPYQYLVSSLRASGVPIMSDVVPLLEMLKQNGQPIYSCLTPNGYKNTQDAWINPDAMIRRLSFSSQLGSGGLPLWRPKEKAPDATMAETGTMQGASEMNGMKPEATSETATPSAAPAKPPRPDAFAIQAALGNRLSLQTVQALAAAPSSRRAGMILGSPEFMWR